MRILFGLEGRELPLFLNIIYHERTKESLSFFLIDHKPKMNDQISWDASLVKKFSSSNHFKLINQLRNEVKKYPLNNKKNFSSIPKEDNNLEKKNKNNSSNSEDLNIGKSHINKDNNSNQSTVSFNNAKNFSIYKKNSEDYTTRLQANNSSVEKESNDYYSVTTFKDRLNQIDMK